MRPDIRESVGAESLRRVRGGNASDGQRPNQAHHGTAQEDQAGNGLAAAERVRHDSGYHHGGNDGNKRSELDDPIAPGKQLLRKKLRQKPVL